MTFSNGCFIGANEIGMHGNRVRIAPDHIYIYTRQVVQYIIYILYIYTRPERPAGGRAENVDATFPALTNLTCHNCGLDAEIKCSSYLSLYRAGGDGDDGDKRRGSACSAYKYNKKIIPGTFV